jgi:phosphoribosyl-ATP pyrophosphohydrolase
MNLESKVLEWAKERDLIKPENAPKQSMKIMEEIGETMRAYLKGDEKELIDGIGDSLVTLIIFSAQCGYSATDCLEAAYNEIANREGKTVNGVFIKNKEG